MAFLADVKWRSDIHRRCGRTYAVRWIHQLIANLDFNRRNLTLCYLKLLLMNCIAKRLIITSAKNLLPATEASYQVLKQLFQGAKKPVFTTDSAHNHLISMAEIFSMYLLVWSPAPWQGLELQMPQDVLNSFSPDRQKRCATYSKNLTDFSASRFRSGPTFNGAPTCGYDV